LHPRLDSPEAKDNHCGKIYQGDQEDTEGIISKNSVTSFFLPDYVVGSLRVLAVQFF
jgi:hypothetical protein